MTWTPTHSGEMLKTGFFHRKIHYTDDPAKDEQWVAKESLRYGGISSARWRREMEVDWDVYGGERVWPMLSRKYHNLSLTLTADWAIYRVIDHGIRHPTCCLWVAVNRQGDKHFFREYYASDKSVAVNSKQILSLSNEIVIDTIIDPSTRKRTNYLTTDTSAEKKGLARLVDLYIENGIPCTLADNSAAGYDKVTDGLLSALARYAIRTGEMPPYLVNMNINQEQLLMLAAKPVITFDLGRVSRCFKETENLRWKELSGDPTQSSEPEKTVDVADEGPDCVRYAVQSELFWRTPVRTNYPARSQQAVKQRRYFKRRRKLFSRWI